MPKESPKHVICNISSRKLYCCVLLSLLERYYLRHVFKKIKENILLRKFFKGTQFLSLSYSSLFAAGRDFAFNSFQERANSINNHGLLYIFHTPQARGGAAFKSVKVLRNNVRLAASRKQIV